MQIPQTTGKMTLDPTANPDRTPEILMQKAQALEAAFLAEMLGHAGLGSVPEGAFAGGIGEEQFASFLRQEQATQIVQRGGVGLAEHLFRAMTRGAA